jgi:plasmid stabilization system protein ParE
LSFRVRISERAAGDIREAADWWRGNRDKAPHAFAEDIEYALQLLVALPGAGERVYHPTILDLRRLLLSRVRYLLYYSVDAATETVEVLALWHTSKGDRPQL